MEKLTANNRRWFVWGALGCTGAGACAEELPWEAAETFSLPRSESLERAGGASLSWAAWPGGETTGGRGEAFSEHNEPAQLDRGVVS